LPISILAYYKVAQISFLIFLFSKDGMKKVPTGTKKTRNQNENISILGMKKLFRPNNGYYVTRAKFRFLKYRQEIKPRDCGVFRFWCNCFTKIYSHE